MGLIYGSWSERESCGNPGCKSKAQSHLWLCETCSWAYDAGKDAGLQMSAGAVDKVYDSLRMAQHEIEWVRERHSSLIKDEE
jgi:hypothetical protein